MANLRANLYKDLPDDYEGPIKWDSKKGSYVPDCDKLFEEEHEQYLIDHNMTASEFEDSVEEYEERRRRRIAEANEY